MASRGHHRRIYAMYHGDDYICEGTVDELSARTGAKLSTIKFYATPAYHQRVSNRPQRTGSIILEPIGWDDDFNEKN